MPNHYTDSSSHEGIRWQGLRVIIVGPVCSAIEHLCLVLDPHTRRADLASEVISQIEVCEDRPAWVVVSSSLSETGCRSIVEDETRLREPVSLGFIVGPDPDLVLERLQRLGEPWIIASGMRHVAFLDNAMSGIGIAGIADLAATGDSPAKLALIARKPIGCAFLYGHSNGHCHGAGGIAICDRDRHHPRASSAHQLPCFGQAECRFSATANYVRVPARELGARMVIDLTCFGFVFNDHVLEARDAVGQALLYNPRLQALVTSVRALSPSESDYLLSAYLVLAGEDAGRIASLLNRARSSEWEGGADFVCFGDPRLRAEQRLLDLGEEYRRRFSVDRPAELSPSAINLCVKSEPARGETLLCAGAVASAWSPDGRIYLTLPEGQKTASVRRVPTDVVRATVNSQALIPALDFLEHHLAALHASPLAVGQSNLARALCDAEVHRKRLKQFALAFRPSFIRDGGTINVNTVAGISKARAEGLQSLAQCLTEVHREAIVERDMIFVAGDHVLEVDANFSLGPPCPYCGAASLEIEKQLPGSSFRRVAVFCDRCGRLREGTGIAQVIKADTVGRRLVVVRVTVTNPFAFEVPIAGVAALQTFDGSGNQIVELDGMFLDAGASAELRAQIPIPDEVPDGVHRIKVAIVVGPQVELLLRYWIVSDDIVPRGPVIANAPTRQAGF